MTSSIEPPVIVAIINPDTKVSPADIVRMINIYQAVKEKRAFNKRVAFRARWKEETDEQGL